MMIYIYILAAQVVIICSDVLGCFSSSFAHFDALLRAGMLEVILELPLVVRIYRRVYGVKEEEKKKEEVKEDANTETEKG